MHQDPSYQNLDAEKIIETIDRLHHRIEERFPAAGLGQVCQQLLSVGRQATQRARWISRPITSLRVATAVLVGLILAGTVLAVVYLKPPEKAVTMLQFIELLEAAINDLVLIGAAIFFLVTLESRIKRGRALKAIHELRSIAHIIDMHQLTKDPERLRTPGQETDWSPKRTMTTFQLGRYLDYCSEMLSLTGKIAALYIQNFDDSVAIASVNEVEALCTGLSRKIWQKIMILHASFDDLTKSSN